MIRSLGGWGVLKSMRRMKIHIKGDERILRDRDFVEKVLSQASEQMERRYRLKAEGWTLTKIAERAAEISLKKTKWLSPGNNPTGTCPWCSGLLGDSGPGPDGNGGWHVPRSEQIRCQSSGH